jgi:hypothetical protein
VQVSVKLDECADEVEGDYDGEQVARLTITARVTPYQTHYMITPSYYTYNMTELPQTPPKYMGVGKWVKRVWRQLKYNWQGEKYK